MRLGDKPEDGALRLGSHAFAELIGGFGSSPQALGGLSAVSGLSRKSDAFRVYIGLPTRPGSGGTPSRRPKLR